MNPKTLLTTLLIIVAALIVAGILIFRDEPGDEPASEPIEIEALEALGQNDTGDYPRAQEFEATEVPQFELELMQGGSFDMQAHRGDVVVVNFWATWCGPCRFEIPELIELYDEYREEGLTILGISTDEHGFDDVRPFAEEMAINYPLVVDEDGSVSSAFGGIYALPTTFIVDRHGMIRERVLGLVTRSSLEPRLQILLSEQV